MSYLPQSTTSCDIGSPFGPNGIAEIQAQSSRRASCRARLVKAVERDIGMLGVTRSPLQPSMDRTPRFVRAYQAFVRCALLVYLTPELARVYAPELERNIAAMSQLPPSQDLRRTATYRALLEISIRSGSRPEGDAGAVLLVEFIAAMNALADHHWQDLVEAYTCLSAEITPQLKRDSRIRIIRDLRMLLKNQHMS